MPARPPRLGALAPLWSHRPHARRARWARWARLAALAPALALAAACQGGDKDDEDEDPTEPRRGVDGTYSLAEFQNRSVPFEAETQDGRTVSVRGGQLELDGGNYQMVLDIRVDGRRENASDEGSYEARGSRVRFSSSATDDEFEGVVSGRQLNIEFDGVTYGFERE